MGKIIKLLVFIFAFHFSLWPHHPQLRWPTTFNSLAFAADSATFSVAADKTSYGVGETIPVILSVDAGNYVSTLSTISITLKISDTSVVEPDNKTAPFTAGLVYSNVFNQSTSGDLVSAVFYINPDSKPTSRSGEIATVNLKALKAGTATISYDLIKATEENTENDYITTSATSLVLTVAGSASVSTSSDSGETAYETVTPTAEIEAAENATTGPELVFVFALLGGLAILILYKLKGRLL